MSCISEEQIVTHLSIHFAEFNSVFAEGGSSVSAPAFLYMVLAELGGVQLAVASVPGFVSLLLPVATGAHWPVHPSEVSLFLWLCYLTGRPLFLLGFFRLVSSQLVAEVLVSL